MAETGVLATYRALRAASMRHNEDVLRCITQSALLSHAKQIGLAFGRSITAASSAEDTLIFDLAIYTTGPGRSRAIDRYARSHVFEPGSDDARMLAAMREARFSLWRIEGQHPRGGLRLTDLLRDCETWLVDEALARWTLPGWTFAGRLFQPGDFAMNSGVIVPMDAELLGEVLLEHSDWLRHGDGPSLAADPRFAIAIYRTAILNGTMEQVAFQPVAAAA